MKTKKLNIPVLGRTTKLWEAWTDHEKPMTQKEANIEMLRGCEIPTHEPWPFGWETDGPF
jgi:hypothetical protein